MSSTDSGRTAEKLVADYLKTLKNKIVAMNWRTRWCEIDIISIKKKVVYFTEVKFRSSDAWGDGFSYITPKKLQQMRFAAEFWLTENSWKGDCALLAASVTSGDNVELIELS